MNYIDPDKLGCRGLSAAQIASLEKIIPWAQFIQTQTFNKCLVEGKPTRYGVFASTVIAHVLCKSQWMTHPVAMHKYGDILANNLCLIPSHSYWTRLTITHDGVKYKAYKNWRECGIDFSDVLAWFKGYEDVLIAKRPADQAMLMSRREADPGAYCVTMNKLIYKYDLADFDWYGS